LFLFTHLLFSFDHFRIGRDATRASGLKKVNQSLLRIHSALHRQPSAISYRLSAIRYGFGGDSRRIHNDPSIRNPQMSLCDRRNIETVSSHHQSSHLVLRNRPKNLE
jgi:hypothetical protein